MNQQKNTENKNMNKSRKENFIPESEFIKEKEKWEKDFNDINNKLFRTLADMENLGKRVEKEKIENRKYKSHSILVKILPTIDMFELALKSENNSEEVRKWLTGFEMIYSNFIKILEEEGVKEINLKIGHEFNSKHHFAIEKIETDEIEEGKITEISNKGYLLHDRLLRPSTVKIAAKKTIKENKKEINEEEIK